MSLNLSVRDINFIKYLWRYYNFFLITPWHDFDNIVPCNSSICKIFATLLIFIKVYWVSDATFLDKHLLFTQKVNYCITTVTITTLNLLTVVKSSFLADGNKWRTLFNNLRYLDLNLHNKGKTEGSIWKNFYFTFVLRQLFFIMSVVYQIHVWTSKEKISFLRGFWLSPAVDMFYEFQIIELMTSVVKSLESRYADLNENFLQCQDEKFESFVYYHRILGETVDLFNSLFGYQTLLITFHIGSQLVVCLNFSFGFLTPSSFTLQLDLLISNFWVVLVIIVSFVRMVILVDSTVQQAERFLDLLYKMQMVFPQLRKNCFLTKFSKHNIRKFTAAGYFQMRKGIIFSVMANVATYFIIAVQLNESQKTT
ncbi:gustatory receptor 110 [Tribolium castaneum]|uniref:Gustatory receptor n=1 Tax=Tribolium castaneum TaxID=7070 RepID=D6WRP7_TRICA|nr:gustatory receptor 110 [Tribolium castaneum]